MTQRQLLGLGLGSQVLQEIGYSVNVHQKKAVELMAICGLMKSVNLTWMLEYDEVLG